MMIITLFLLITIIIQYKYHLLDNKYIYINYFIISFLSFIYLSETFCIADKIFFMFDEEYFYQEALNKTYSSIFLNILSLYNVYFFFVKSVLEGFHFPVLLKIINVFFSIWLMILFSRKYENNEIIRYYPIFLPYLFTLSFTNMRDSMMLLVFFSLIYFLTKKKSIKEYIIIFILSFLLISLRPMWLLMIYGSYLLILFLRGNIFIKIGSLILIGIILIFSIDFLINEIYRALIFSNIINMRAETIEALERYGNNFILLSIIRQLTTPFPHTKIQQLLSGTPSENLYIFEIARTIMMISYYYLIFYVVKYRKRFYEFIKKDVFNQVLLLTAIINTIFYAVYIQGGGSSRNKVFPIILLFLFFCYMKNNKKHILVLGKK